MANIPELRSPEQIIGEIIDSFLARAKGVDDLNEGSVLLQYIDAVGRNTFRSSADVIQMVDAFSIERAVGEALQRIAIDKNVPILASKPAIGKVRIIDISFSKIETSIYAGQPAPVAGSITIFVTDASDFNENGGQVYIDRGSGQLSSNIEGPLTYTSITQEGGGSYWAIHLDPTNPTTKFHNNGEKILFAQGGDRLIAVGTVVSTKTGATNQVAKYSTSAEAIILDGDTTVENIPITATEAGTQSNTFRGAVTEVTGLDFQAACFNDQPITGGTLSDNDETLRNRVKRFEQTKARGTSAAIQASIIDIVAPDDLKRVSSSSVVDRSDSSSALIFDDGTGYEVITNGVGVEQVVDSALGGEQELQLRQYPIAIARVENVTKEPYSILNGQQLSISIKGESEIHQFSDSDFKVLGKSTALEIAASINGNPNIHFYATTSQGRTQVVLYPRDRFDNDIKVDDLPSNNSNDILNFPLTEEFTSRIYKNDEPLFEDGLLASIPTKDKPSWTQNIADGDTLEYEVDGTPAITATFTLADFQAIDPTATVSFFTDIEIWAQVMNNKMPGVEATISADVINLTSNRGADNQAKLELTGGSLLLKIFEQDISASVGRGSDYTLNKNTGQIGLTDVLQSGDYLSAGSPFTRANTLTGSLPAGPPGAGNLWMVIDGTITLRSNNLKTTSLLQFVKAFDGTLEITSEDVLSNPEGFDDVEVGDWLLVWSETTDITTLTDYSRFWRVTASEIGKVTVDDSGYTPTGANTSPSSPSIMPSDRFVFVKTSAPMQRLSFTIGSLNDFREEIEDQISGISASIVGSKIRISTKSFDKSIGEVAVIAADAGGKSVGFSSVVIKNSVSSQNGFASVLDSEVSMISFTHGNIGTKITPAIFTQTNFKDLKGKESNFLEVLNLYNNDPDDLREIIDSNKTRRSTVSDYDDTLPGLTFNMTLDIPDYLGPEGSQIQEDDRIFFRDSFKFDSGDLLSVIVDGDSGTKAFTLPISRGLVVKSSPVATLIDFSANDAQSSLDLGDPSSFFDFSFDNFKLWRKSNITLTDGFYGLKFLYGDFGPSGNSASVGFVYPADTSEIELTHRISTNETINIGIVIPVSTDRGSNWDGSSSFIVDLISTAGGKDTVKYSWTAGTEPDFLSLGVAIDDVIFINESSGFLSGNKDFAAKITNVTSTTLTIERPTGEASSDALEIEDFSNAAGVTTITTSSAHNMSVGDRIGLYNTAIVTGSTAPFDDIYLITGVISSTVFTINTPTSANEGSIPSASHNAVRVQVTSAAHGLDVGNIIDVDNVISPYGGLAVVVEILDANTFTYRRPGLSSVSINNGNWYFQSYDNGINAFTIASATTTGNLEIDFTTSSAHNYSVNDIIEISGTNPDDWDNTITYTQNTVIRYSGINYLALSSIAASEKEVTDIDVSGATGAGVDGKYFILQDKLGDVGVWYDTDNNGTPIPAGASAALRNIKITTVNTGDISTLISTKTRAVLDGDSEFTSINTGPNATSTTDISYGTRPLANAGDSGFTVSQNQAGSGDGDPTANTNWTATDISFDSRYIITSVPTSTTFKTLIYEDVNMSHTAGVGSVVDVIPAGDIARSIGVEGTLLQIAEVKTTSQEVIDYIATTIPDMLTASLSIGTGIEEISTSTEDEGALLNYLSGVITSLTTFPSNRKIEITVDSELPRGSNIEISGISGYNGSYVILSIEGAGPTFTATIQTSTLASSGSTSVVSGTFTGTTPFLLMQDGENIVETTDLQAIVTPMITAKDAWVEAPVVGEEIKVVATNAEQLERFWNEQVVTGLSSFTDITASQYGRGLQIATDTFGSSGSIQIIGGKANSTESAIIGSATELDNKTASFTIPSTLRNGLNADQWIKIIQTAQSFKTTEYSETTVMSLHQSPLPKLEITSGENFVRQRSIAADSTTIWKIEKHGDFFAFIHVGGTDPLLSTGLVEEGDWVRIANDSAAVSTWTNITNYIIGDEVKFGTKLYLALQNNGISSTVVQPDTDSTVWRPIGWNEVNEGVFQVVRIFEEGSFWVSSSESIEEITVQDNGILEFYDHDSVMPGDEIIIATDEFGKNNIARYTVSGSVFPVPGTIHLDTIPNSEALNITLGSEFPLVQTLEKDTLTLWKKIIGVGQSSFDLATVIVDSPNLMNRISESSGAGIEVQGKLSFTESVSFGLDAYKSYGGLPREINRVVYGDPTDPLGYPGVRAAGTDVPVQAAIIKRISLALALRIRTGVPFEEVSDRVKSFVAAYVNSLGVGEQVSLSSVIAAASQVNGVISVTITSPEFGVGNDLIQIGLDQKALIINPTLDIIVSILGI